MVSSIDNAAPPSIVRQDGGRTALAALPGDARTRGTEQSANIAVDSPPRDRYVPPAMNRMTFLDGYLTPRPLPGSALRRPAPTAIATAARDRGLTGG